jgi:hypothetical protein
MITGMADSLGLSRSVVLVGFLAAALGLATVTYLAFPGVWSSPGSWTSHDVAVLISIAGSALFYVLFGWAFWLWLPRLDGGSRRAPTARLGLRLLAAAGLLLALAYSAETYQTVRLVLHGPYFGKFDLHVLLCVAYGVMALGFTIAAIGFWVGSLTFTVSSDDHDGLASTMVRPPLVRAQGWVIGGGLAVGATGAIFSMWPYRISYSGAVAKAQVILGCGNALALVFMAVGFAALLVDQPDLVARGRRRAPLSVLGVTFLVLAASNLADVYQVFRPFAGATEWDLAIGPVLQSAGAFVVAVGFFAAAWTAPSAQTGPVDPSPVAGGQPELVPTY